jgi:Zn-finger nucleic acid-binding protein
VQAIIVHGCSLCGGLWLDQLGFKELVVDPSTRDALPHASAGAGSPESDRDVTLACPVCASDLTRGTVGGVVIDSCAQDGIWFDAAEIDVTLDWALAQGWAETYRAEIEELRRARAARVAAVPQNDPHVQLTRPRDEIDQILEAEDADEIKRVLRTIARRASQG